MQIKESVMIGGKPLTIETGKMAKQANGSVVVQYGETVVLITAVGSPDDRDVDFLPLTVEYTERMYSAGRIPGSYFRREGRPSIGEILCCRLIDRPIRPLFQKGYRSETQIIAMVLSSDQENDADVLAITGASAALHISDLPFNGPIAGIRVGRINGEFVANPTKSQLAESDFNIIVAASFDALVMVEGSCDFVSEEDMIEALAFAQEAARPLLELQEKLRSAVGLEKRVVTAPQMDQAIVSRVDELAAAKLSEVAFIREKQRRYEATAALKNDVIEAFGPEFAERREEISSAFSALKKKTVRTAVVERRSRIDGRQLDEIRPIHCEIGILPRPHGSALFTRGETQALATVTLGSQKSDQRIESIMGDYTKSFMLHYNFPPFSTGEARRFGSPGRREIGHGNLAERSLLKVMPEASNFPYVTRIVSEVLESNGSSSMASVCGGSLALMDAGVPVAKPVAGIAMGLIQEGDAYAVLSDILGDEDHLGDMDFKVTGTSEGITACQMDIKIKGLSYEILVNALKQAREGRLHILGKITDTIATPAETVKEHAPTMVTRRVPNEFIGALIGPGGKVIQEMQKETGTTIVINEDPVTEEGIVEILGVGSEGIDAVLAKIDSLLFKPTVGSAYEVKVIKMLDFGAVVEYAEAPGNEVLLHVSELAWERTENVTDVVNMGDVFDVKYFGIDSRTRKEKVSRKALLPKPEGYVERPPRTDRPKNDRNSSRDRKPKRD